jgi:hypothetical protein
MITETETKTATNQTALLSQDSIPSLVQQSNRVIFKKHYEQLSVNSNLTTLTSIIIESGFNIGLNESAELAYRLAKVEYPNINFIRAYLDGVNVVFVVSQESIKNLDDYIL